MTDDLLMWYDIDMKYLGQICRREPEHGNERYRFKHGTVCVQCHILRISNYRSMADTDKAKLARKKLATRGKSDKKRRYLANYAKCRYFELRARSIPQEDYARWRSAWAASLRVHKLEDRRTFLRQHYESIVLPALKAMRQEGTVLNTKITNLKQRLDTLSIAPDPLG